MFFVFDFVFFFFFFNDPATTEIYTLSLHDALPISFAKASRISGRPAWFSIVEGSDCESASTWPSALMRSEEHTSELQSHSDLVCRLLLEKKKNKTKEKPTRMKKRKNKSNATTTTKS